jgi:hypothetical protein
MKKLFILFFSLFMLFFTTYSYAKKKSPIISSKAINVIVDGKSFPGLKVYKMSGHINYFSVREIAKIYNATLEWKPVSSQVTMQ